MFRWLLVAIATGALMLGLELSRILLGMREIAPTPGHWLGLVVCVVVMLGTLIVIGFLDYKVEKKKGNVVRQIPLFERALDVSQERQQRAREARPDDEKES